MRTLNRVFKATDLGSNAVLAILKRCLKTASDFSGRIHALATEHRLPPMHGVPLLRRLGGSAQKCCLYCLLVALGGPCPGRPLYSVAVLFDVASS